MGFIFNPRHYKSEIIRQVRELLVQKPHTRKELAAEIGLPDSFVASGLLAMRSKGEVVKDDETKKWSLT